MTNIRRYFKRGNTYFLMHVTHDRMLLLNPGSDVERLSQKATILARVGWGLVSHLIIGGHKARRYAELANSDFIWCHVQCSWSHLLRQPHLA